MSPSKAAITLELALTRQAEDSFRAFAQHVSPVEAQLLRVANFDKLYTRAEGLYLYDDTGQSFMDFTAGFGALNLGHNPREVIDAVSKARSLPAVLLAGFSPLSGALAEALSEIVPGELSVTCFGNGGAEAVEIALKTARAATARTRLLSCDNAYHGLSFGAMSVSGNALCRSIFGPLVEHCESVPFGDVAALHQHLAHDNVAAFIVEPVQGEGGAIAPPVGYLTAVVEACRAHGTLLILDEIQTGFGRTGRLFAAEHEGIVPDMMLLSKSLGGGVVPISVCCMTKEVSQRAYGSRDRVDLVTSTFARNPAACAAGLKSIEITIRDRLADRAASLGRYARKRLQELAQQHQSVKSVRGEGLLLGIELSSPVSGAITDENYAVMVASSLLNNHRVLTCYFDLAPTVLRFEPPLIVTKEEIDLAIDGLNQVLSLGLHRLALSVGKGAISRVIHAI